VSLAEKPGTLSQQDQPAACLRLRDARISGVTELSPIWRSGGAGDRPFCQVVGRIDRNGSFEVRLPADGWNGGFYMAGCSGMCGALEAPDQLRYMRYALAKGYAVATTDGGHTGTNVLDATFAVGDPGARDAFAFGAVHAVARASKAIISAFYESAPRRSVFEGCSTGGRQGLIEAERFPDDFDGIISGSPAFDAAGLNTYWAWLSQTDSNGHGGWRFPAGKVALLQQAVLKACGDAEGVVEDPRACHFRPEALACRRESNASACLTPSELVQVRRWYDGPKCHEGRALFTDGVPLGSEAYWIRPGMPEAYGSAFNFQKAAVEIGLRYLLIDPAPGPGFRVDDFDIDRDRGRLAAADKLMTPGPDLSGFKARGGKLLIYQGWADAVTPPLRVAAYYKAVAKRLGGRARADGVVRLFMLPGFNHCGGPGVGSSMGLDIRSLTPLPMLEHWLDVGPSDTLLVTKFDAAGSIQWSRGVCAFPQRTTYTGEGDQRLPASWRCLPP
jgi:feruloyl esterase